MARKKTKAAARRMRRWISTGVVTCSFIGFLVYLSNVPQPSANETVNVFNRSSVEAHVKSAPALPAAHYTFYRDLPELKVIAKDVAENLPARVQQLADTVTADTDAQADTSHPVAIAQEKPVPTITKKASEKVASHPKEKAKQQLALETNAFSTLAEADHRRAELLLMGLNARIEKTQTNGTTQYRILVGPFANRDNTAKMHDSLAQNNMGAAVKAVSN